jgi:xylulose-5-phosphate/fructose-6-phosphate phosphoketolase
MVVLNHMSRFHLARLALRFSELSAERIHDITETLDRQIEQAVEYSRVHFEDPPEIREWSWTTGARS